MKGRVLFWSVTNWWDNSKHVWGDWATLRHPLYVEERPDEMCPDVIGNVRNIKRYCDSKAAYTGSYEPTVILGAVATEPAGSSTQNHMSAVESTLIFKPLLSFHFFGPHNVTDRWSHCCEMEKSGFINSEFLHTSFSSVQHHLAP